MQSQWPQRTAQVPSEALAGSVDVRKDNYANQECLSLASQFAAGNVDTGFYPYIGQDRPQNEGKG